MTSELFRLARVDLSRSKWLILAYVVALALSATAAVLAATAPEIEQTTASITVDLPGLILAVTGVLLIASLIQNDSPTRSDAFWRSTPTSPRMLLAAKGVSAMITLAIPAIVAQCVALSFLPVTSREIVNFTLHSACYAAGPILSVAIVAAITPSLRAFILALLVFAIATVLCDSLPVPDSTVSVMNAGGLSAWVRILLATIQLCWLVTVYTALRRWTLRAHVLSACVVLCLTFIPIINFRLFWPGNGIGAAAKIERPAIIPSHFTAEIDSASIAVQFKLPAPDRLHRLSLADLRVVVITASGQRERFHQAANPSGFSMTTADGSREVETVLFPQEAESYAVDSSMNPPLVRVGLRLVPRTPAQRELLRENGLRLEFDAFLETQIQDTIAIAPLDLGRTSSYLHSSIQPELLADKDDVNTLQIAFWSLIASAFESPEFLVDGDESYFSMNVDTPVSQFLKLARGSEVDRTIVSASGSDNRRLRAGTVRVKTASLPIPVSGFARGTQLFGHADQTRAALAPSDINGHKLVTTVWRYEQHRQIHMSVPLR